MNNLKCPKHGLVDCEACLKKVIQKSNADQQKIINRKEIISILEEMPLHYSTRIKFGENEYALKMIRKTTKNATMRDIQDYNIESDGWTKGYEKAINDIKEWRNKKYLELKNMK